MSVSVQNRPAQQSRSDSTRKAILAAAERVFAVAGLAGARTDAIAAEAHVNKALLYYYFQSKQRLYEAVLESQFKEFNGMALAVLNASGTARKVLLDYVSLHFDFISQRRRHASLFQQMMIDGGKPLKRLVSKYFVPRSQALGNLLDRGMREGAFRKADQFHLAISIVALIVFYFSASPILQSMGHADIYNGANLRRRKQEVFDFIRYGLFIDPAPRPGEE